jgi:hypothetical protein
MDDEGKRMLTQHIPSYIFGATEPFFQNPALGFIKPALGFIKIA